MNKEGTGERRTTTTRRTLFSRRLRKYSDPVEAQRKAFRYLGKTARIYPSLNPQKKYDIFDKKHNKWVHFGQLGYEDYTRHKDKKRRKNYLTRTAKMRGDWKRNPYSANNLSRRVLW